jgi:hypothetical protein
MNAVVGLGRLVIDRRRLVVDHRRIDQGERLFIGSVANSASA